ncbi:hypothetical protein PT250_08695, partial [Erysipelothrix rhusiopathiae]|nr:hypothetical protein [Erysipelothrix rhusiopathiae]
VSINGNQVTIHANANSPEQAKITFKKYGNITNNSTTTPILYSHPNKQDIISGGNPDPIPFVINVEVEYKGTPLIGKVNEETQGKIPDIFKHKQSYFTITCKELLKSFII